MNDAQRASAWDRVQSILKSFSQPWRSFLEASGPWAVLEPPQGVITAETMQHVRQHPDVHTVEAIFRSTPSPGIYLRFRLRNSAIAADLDTSTRIHCESFLDTVPSRIACEDEQGTSAHDKNTEAWPARRFLFGIRHPDLQDRMCPICVQHVRRLVGVPA